MRDTLKTLPEAGNDEEKFDEIWEKARERWGVNSSKVEDIKNKLGGGIGVPSEKEPSRPSSRMEPKPVGEPAQPPAQASTNEEDLMCERPTIPMDEPKPDSLAVTQRSSELMTRNPDDTPEIIIDETHTNLKSEILFLLIEEAVLRIRNFEFESVTVEPGKSHLTNAIAKTLGNICESEDLLLMIAVDANKFTILKKGWIDYNGRVMDEKKGYVFHSLLKNYPNAVTIK